MKEVQYYTHLLGSPCLLPSHCSSAAASVNDCFMSESSATCCSSPSNQYVKALVCSNVGIGEKKHNMEDTSNTP